MRSLAPLLLIATLGAAPAAGAQESAEVEDAPAAVASPLAGLNEAEVRGKLGEPALARAEGAGAFWTYRLPRCALFVYFTDAGQGLRVTGAASGPRRHGDAAPAIDACLAEAAAVSARGPAHASAPAASAPR